MTQPTNQQKTFILDVWGDYGCFTRPETKVERFSYPVITPSAGRAIFDAIYLEFEKSTGRPAHRWELSRVDLLSPVRRLSMMHNEVKEKVSVTNIKKWMKDPASATPMITGAGNGSTQRQTIVLKAPRYRLYGHAVLFREDRHLRQKIERSFERRAARGQCIYQPYLGCREFAADFHLAGIRNPYGPSICPEQVTPVDHSETIGWMLYDVFDLSRPGHREDEARVSLFQGRIDSGVMLVPPYLSADVRRPPGLAL